MFWNSLLKEPLVIPILISKTVSTNVNFWILMSEIHLRYHSLNIIKPYSDHKTTKVINIWYPLRWR